MSPRGQRLRALRLRTRPEQGRHRTELHPIFPDRLGDLLPCPSKGAPAALRATTRPRAALAELSLKPGTQEVESPVLLRPPRRRAEHRAPELAPGDALVAVLVQRVDRREDVVHVADAEHLGELLVVP